MKNPNYYNADFLDPEVIDLKVDDFESNYCFQIDIAFSNDSEFPIVGIAILAGSFKNNNCRYLYGIKNIEERSIYIAKNEAANIRFLIPCQGFNSIGEKQLTLHIWFGNIFDYKTQATLFIDDINKEGKARISLD